MKTCWRAALTGPAWETCSDQRGPTVCPVLTATSARLRRCSCIEHEENIFGILHRVNERRVGLPSQTSELDIPFARCARNLIRAAEARKHRSYRLFKGIRTPAMRRFIRPRLGLVWVVGRLMRLRSASRRAAVQFDRQHIGHSGRPGSDPLQTYVA